LKAFIGELRNQYQLQGASANRDHWLHLMRTNPEMQFQLDMLVTEQKLNFEKYLENKKLYGKHF
jgi:predicted ester cyclase